MKNTQVKKYTKNEEIANGITHGLGVAFGIFSLIVLLYESIKKGSTISIVGFSIYGASLIIMYLASTMYHIAWKDEVKKILRVFDHSSIFIFIAGTYTPIILLTMRGKMRVGILTLIWLIAISGVVFKIFTFNKFDKYKMVSLALYIGMGWITIFLIRPILESTSVKFIVLLALGGIIYTLGTIFYSNKKIPYNHAIWHLFVLAASFVHFLGIYLYLA